MKTTDHIKRLLLALAIALGMTCATPASAIEGLELSLQCSNVVLTWPSIPGQSYIIQYRPTLDPSTPWETLTNSYPADDTTNITVFVHSNIVLYPCNCGNSSGAPLAAMSLASSASASSPESPAISQPMVKPADGSGATVPLALYPPGYDFSNYLIYDPTSGDWVSGAEYTTSSPSAMTLTADDGTPFAPLPAGGGSGGGGSGTTNAPDMGFYQVVQNGVQIASSSLAILTNAVLSNTVNIKFEAGNADPNNGTNLLGILDSAVLIVDGTQFPGDGVLSAPTNGSPWQFTMDTAYLENGYHTIQVEVTWQNPDSTDNQNPVFTAYSDSIGITVTNPIYYPNWEPEIGELGISAYFVETTCTNANWTIDIYDSGSNLVNSLTGYTTDGTITAYWNMTDTNGVIRTNADTDPYFDSVITVGDPVSKKAPRKNQRRKDWPDHGVWTIAYQDFFKFEYDDQGYMKGSLNQFAYTAQKYGGYYLYYPQPGQTNDIGQTYPIRFQKTNHYDPTITSAAIAKDHAMFLAMLSNTNSRNLYLSSHGSATTVAGGFPASDVQKYVKQRYRFVFLDGCETAKGSWDKAFGINGPGQFAITYYQNTGIRPAAFCGYDRKTYYATGGPVVVNGVQYDDTISWQAGGFIINFLFYWDLEGYGLSDAFYYGGNGLPPIGPWFPGAGLQIYGFSSLSVDGYNHKTDWQ